MEGNKIKYSKEFKSIEGTEWIGVDVVVNEGEDWMKKWNEAYGLVHNFQTNKSFKYQNIEGYKLDTVVYPAEEKPIPVTDYKAKDEVEIAIDNAANLDELAKLKIQAEKYYLQSAYISKMKQFV